MKWLAGWDFPSRTAPALPTLLAQLIFALLVTIVMIVLRMAIDVIAPGAGPLSLTYPAVMVATLFGRWFAGLLTLIATIAYTIFFVLPPTGDFVLEHASDGPRVVVNVVVLIVTVVLLETFRSAIARANADRDRQIMQRDLLLAEFDHRLKNNFTAVAGLLQLQLKRATDPVVREELAGALNRVESIATANRFLYSQDAPAGVVDIAAYLGELCAALAAALLRTDRVKLHCQVEPATIDRDRTVAIGLIVNELVTNAARHAFPDERTGTITVTFRRSDPGYELVVQDDGCGLPPQPRDGSLGRRLIAAFVRDAKGELRTESSAEGTRCSVLLP